MAPAVSVGVLVMAYGSPADADDIERYYTDIRRGRPPTAEQLCDLRARYAAIGGTSALRTHTEAQVAAVRDELGTGFVVELGMRHAAPSIEDAVERLHAAGVGVPSIHFGVGTGELLEPMAAAGADVMGVDWRVPIADARRRLPGLPVQGNLDPVACLAPWPVVEQQAREVIDGNAGRPGHIFNLGHGVLPDTDPGVLAALVAWVHEHRWPQR